LGHIVLAIIGTNKFKYVDRLAVFKNALTLNADVCVAKSRGKSIIGLRVVLMKVTGVAHINYKLRLISVL
jgi:hypothetical protein